MSYYSHLYKRRINRFGTNAASRLEEGRRINFERFLKQSPHYLVFDYEDEDGNVREVECVFEPRSQNETKVVMDILCRVGEKFKVGSIATINGKRYMFWYWDERQDSGYNRWVVIQLSMPITWVNEDGTEYQSEAYIYSQEDNMLKNELKSRSRSATLYLENLKLEFMMMPVSKNLKINSYLELEICGIEHYWRVTGIDSVSTPGMMYVSMDPTLKRDLTPAPAQTIDDDPDDYYWLGEV